MRRAPAAAPSAGRRSRRRKREWAGTGANSCLTPAANGRARRGRPKTAGPSGASAQYLDIYSTCPGLYIVQPQLRELIHTYCLSGRQKLSDEFPLTQNIV